jgi:hypothetical protein
MWGTYAGDHRDRLLGAAARADRLPLGDPRVHAGARP